jgi:5'-nucleotidase
VEEDWLQTIVNLPSVEFLDFVLEGRRLATELRSQGAQLVVALTHMRMPNAEKYDHLGINTLSAYGRGTGYVSL